MNINIIEDSILSGLADKIREKLGVPDKFLPSAFGAKIGEIASGGGEGVYAWKRTKKATVSFTQLNSGVTPLLVQCSSDDVDLTTVDATFFHGMTGVFNTTNTYTFTEDTKFKTNAGILYDYTYDPTTMQLSMNCKFNGIYVWEDCETVIGTDYILADEKDAYPENGVHTDGHEYNMIVGDPWAKITWADGTDEEIVAMIAAADAGEINLSDYWKVGDTRQVQLTAPTGYEQYIPTQTAELVLMHEGGYTLQDAVASGRTTCSFVVGFKNAIGKMPMDATGTDVHYFNTDGCAKVANGTYFALPKTLRDIFKLFKAASLNTYNNVNGAFTQSTRLLLPTEIDVIGTNNISHQNENEFSFQFEWYKNSSNRIKTYKGSTTVWWTRSIQPYVKSNYCAINTDGTTTSYSYSNSLGISPVGVI